jgi:hypothetical protein
MKYRYGWGSCSHCSSYVGATKNGKAVRHGFIRVRRGYWRLNLSWLKSGQDHNPCEGSGEPLNDWHRQDDV